MNYEMFQTMTKLTEKQLKMFMSKVLRDAYGNSNVNESDDYICAYGNTPICLVAHLDIVYDEEDRDEILILRDSEKKIMWSPDGLAADDRAGVLMISEIIDKCIFNKNMLPHVILTTSEETDVKGAIEVGRKLLSIWGNILYFIELDRQGHKDSVFYSCDNPDFEKYINSFGFKTAQGTYTDISFICPLWKIAGVNLSVGYYNEHSYSEMLVESHWDDTFLKVMNMLRDANRSPRWDYIPSKTPDPYYEYIINGGNK